MHKAMIDSPTEKDILFGRNPSSWNHEGNKRFRTVVAKHQGKYHSTKSRAQKVAFVATIVNELKSSGTRFLKRDYPNKEYYEVDRKACIEKVFNSVCHFISAGLTDVNLQRFYLQVGRAIRDKTAIPEQTTLKKSQEEMLYESAKSLSIGHARPVPSFVGVRRPNLTEFLLVQRNAARYADAQQSKHQALDSTAQQLVAVDSLIVTIQEQQKAEKDLAACRQRRDMLTSFLTTSRSPDKTLLTASNRFGGQSRSLPSLQTIRRHSAVPGRPQLASSSALLASMLSRSSVTPAALAAALASKFS